MACHRMDQPLRLVGPSLYDIGKRQSRGEIYESLLEPDAKVVEGFPPGLMTATLMGNGFLEKVSPKELKLMIDYLASLQG